MLATSSLIFKNKTTYNETFKKPNSNIKNENHFFSAVYSTLYLFIF